MSGGGRLCEIGLRMPMQQAPKSNAFRLHHQTNAMKHVLLGILILGMVSEVSSQITDKIFFSSFRPEGWDIYLSRDNGASFSAFTDHESLDYDARISPDGEWVVFTSERNGFPQLYIKHILGDSLPRPLVSSQSMQDQVDFSPDGQWIAFVSTHEGNADIYKLPFQPNDTLDVAEAQNLTRHEGGDFRPCFSNDGQRIAFSSDRAHPTIPLQPRFFFALQRTGDVYVMDAEGGAPTRLTDSKNWEGSPVWTADDSHILFYSANNDENFKLFRMSSNGEDPEQLSPDSHSCLSPIPISNEEILFTSFERGPNGFALLGLDLNSFEIDSSLVQPMNMLNPDFHSSGLLVYHGGETPQPTEANRNEFFGDLLVKNSPRHAAELPNRTLGMYGVRRAFAAPATPDGKIIYGTSDLRGFQDAIAPAAFVVLLLPLLAIVWLIVGVVRSIRKRKSIAFWKHLLFAVFAVGIVVFIVNFTDDQLFFDAMPLDEVKSSLLIIVGVLLVLGIGATLLSRRKQQPIASLYKLYAWMFIPYAVIVLYAAIFLSSFFNSEKTFYAVDYTTNEVKELFVFHPHADFNPQFSNILDTKLTPDGQYVQFSVGGFRMSPQSKGCVYRYHLVDGILEQVTDLESNTGFADYSADNKVMIYRSGRTGNMDIYVEENGTVTNLTDSPDKEAFPVISHDGNKIAYCSDATGVDKDGLVKTMDLFLVERTDSGWGEPQRITTYPGQEAHAHFSPDGEWLIYTTEEYGINDEQPLVQSFIFSPQLYGEITAMRLEDGKKFRLTHNKWEDGAPLWGE